MILDKKVFLLREWTLKSKFMCLVHYLLAQNCTYYPSKKSPQTRAKWKKKYIAFESPYKYSFSFFLVGLEFELRASHLQGWCPTT
jgi:hypothetical protein